MLLRGGRYELLQSIASGGMATVHLARALGAGGFERLVAIKVMHPHIAAEPEFVTMFLDEARLAAQIRHPNVVGTFDVQQDEEGIFIVMEYVEGPSLHLIIRTLKRHRATPPLSILLRIFLDSLAGLHAAHELVAIDGSPINLVHRDVSPQNILVGVDGVSRITDFGVAKAESRLASTKTGQVKGKAGYIAPEQLRCAPLDRRTDIYSAGVLLWEILAGDRLIQGESDMVMLSKILTADHQRPREVNLFAPEALDAVAMRAISSDVDARYPTAAAFAEAVEAAARRDSVEIASARTVAAFVRELDAHVSPVELTPVSSMPSVRPSFRTQATHTQSSVPSGATPPPVSPISVPDTLACAAPPETGRPSVLAVRTDMFSRPRYRGLWVGVGTGAVLASAVWLLASPRSDRNDVPSVSESGATYAMQAVGAGPRRTAMAAASAAAVITALTERERPSAAVRGASEAKDLKETREVRELKREPIKPFGVSPASSHTPSYRPKDL